ncbi:MAG TPA: glycosyltransferase family 2 protein [Patescibacteria group bacterium]
MPIKEKKVYILIPAYNEAKKISSVITDLMEAGYKNILVVNDGSKDETATIAKQAGAEVLNHVINRGQGAALQTGMKYLRETYSPDAVVTFDADGQHQTQDIQAMVDPVLNGECDITLGSRFLDKKSNVSPLRKIILKAGIQFTNHISNIKLTDTHNGFRALSKKALEEIEIFHRGMEHASDIIDEITKHRLRYKEVPVHIAYTDYSKQKGTNRNMDFIKMGIKIILNKISN